MSIYFHPIAPVEVNVHNAARSDKWVTLNLPIPVGATGAILRLQTIGTGYNYGVRKTGSTDARLHRNNYVELFWLLMGVNASRQIDVYNRYGTFFPAGSWDLNVWVIGYTTEVGAAGIKFFTNGVDISKPGGGVHIYDCSSICPNAMALILEFATNDPLPGVGGGTGQTVSSPRDDFEFRRSFDLQSTWAIVGCTSDQKIRVETNTGSDGVYVIGYIPNGSLPYNTWHEVSSSPINSSWEVIDVSAVCPDSEWAVIFWCCWDLAETIGIRPLGSAEVILQPSGTNADILLMLVPLSVDKKFEMYYSRPSHFFVVLGPPSEVSTGGATEITTSSARLAAQLDFSQNMSCRVGVHYGLTTDYGDEEYDWAAGAPYSFSSVIHGLLPGHTYHYRAFVRRYVCGHEYFTYGEDNTFTTLPESSGVKNPGDILLM